MRAALVAACCAWSVVPAAQTARLTVLADSVSAGAPFEVAVTVTRGPGQQVAFPEVPVGPPEAGGLRIGDVEALSLRRLPPAVRGGLRVDSAVVEAVTFAADTARVGPVAVRVQLGDSVAVVRTGSALVPVRSVLAGEAPPYEPAPLGPADAFPSAAPLWVALGALALLVLGAAGWGLARLVRTPERRARVLPYAAAVRRLDALDAEAPAAGAAPEAVEAHVVAVRAVLRDYLAGRLGVRAREATTAELAAGLEADARVPADAVEAVRRALQPADLVAFARVRPEPHVVARLREATRGAVEAVERGARRAESAPDGTSDDGPGLGSPVEAPTESQPPVPAP